MPEVKALCFCSQDGLFFNTIPPTPETAEESVQTHSYSVSYNSGNPRMPVAWIRLYLPMHQGGRRISSMFTETEILWL